MGNRAVIAIEKEGVPKEYSPAIYVHWNGGRDSIEAFLEAAKRMGVRLDEDDYFLARLTQLITNFFGGTLSVGVGNYCSLDTNNYYNGVYWLKNGEIVGREFAPEEEQTGHDFEEMVEEVLNRTNKEGALA